MRKLRAAWARVLGLFHSDEKENDIDTELSSHVQMHVDDNIRAGMTMGEARRDALVKMGGFEQTRQGYREQATVPFIENLVRDVRVALRQLRSARAFSVAVIATLALGIGANTAIFSVVNAVLQNPAGVDHPGQVIVLNTAYKRLNLNIPYISTPTFSAAASLPQVEAAAIESSASFNIGRGGRMDHVSAARVSSRWFQVFGARPILGRTFVTEDEQGSGGTVAILSYGLWQSRFGGAPDIVGQTVALDDRSYRIIGVAGSDFAWPRAAQLWIPLGLSPAAYAPSEAFNETYQGFIRLRSSVNLERFNAGLSSQLLANLRSLGRDSYASSSGWSVFGTHLTDFAAGSLKKPLYVTFGIVVLVLLIAVANVAGLTLARGSARSKEFALRLALGASVGRIVQQFLVETLLLTSIATVIGVIGGPPLGHVILLLVPHSLAAGFVVHTDMRVLAFTAVTALLTSLMAGLGPALQLLRQSRGLQTHFGVRSATASGEKQRLRSTFVILEVALAFLLLVGTGLFLSSLARLQRVDPGFVAEGVVAAKVEFSGEVFKSSQEQRSAFVRVVVEQLASRPHIHSAAAIEPLPFDPDASESNSFDIEGRPKPSDDPGPHSHLSYSSPGYLEVMKIPLGNLCTGMRFS